MEKFAIGLVIGGLSGALLATNNYKMRTLIKKGQEEVQMKLDKLMDEKIDEMSNAVEKAKEEVSETADNVKEHAEELTDKARKSFQKKENA
jgi:Na+/phosphate symporter